MKRLFVLFCLLFCNIFAFAQQSSNVEMADVMRSSGKIYVVIGVICIVFIGLAIYLFTIDRRLKKIEKHN